MTRKSIVVSALIIAATGLGTAVAHAEFYDTGLSYRTYDDCAAAGYDNLNRGYAEDFRCSFTKGAFDLYLDAHKEAEHSRGPASTGSAG
ncbi:hypothetical protein ACIP5Y_31595 [Nocardia sp. NPDC088792]|uniref:hypothetical protein n=1 Tax=Nocardia sp. NPDC088792 TaxID=3364332 RepID=UPI00381072E7